MSINFSSKTYKQIFALQKCDTKFRDNLFKTIVYTLAEKRNYALSNI